MNVLVTGGAGYIGSIMVKRLLEDNHKVVVVDNLERGHENAVDQRAYFQKGDLLNKEFVREIFNTHPIEAVVHFAGLISMGESMKNPSLYFSNNVFASLNVLEAMKDKNIHKFIFSSTAGVYGNPIQLPISEDHPKSPTNPYGESKLMVERILNWYLKLFGISYVALRYFNAAGALMDASLGESHDPETHIIPNAIKAFLTKSEFSLFGDDYNTPDKTAIRDYIHVIDLVEAHMLALEKLNKQSGGFIYNVGTGRGWSNKEVLAAIEKVAGGSVQVRVMPRREGDAEELVADSKKIKEELGFSPRYSDLSTIVESAWKWHIKSANAS